MADQPDVAGFIQAGWERNSYIACATLVGYEYLLQLGPEVEFFWKQGWSIAKALFLWSRYYSLGYNISNAAVFVLSKPSFKLCTTFFHWQNTGASLQVITTHIILELRLYAMYGSTRKILALFVTLTLGEALAMGLIFGLPNPKAIGTNEPFTGNLICADADPLDGSHWVMYYWAAILIIESVLLCLAMYKAWQHRNAARGSRLMQQLTRDSVIYFFTIFWIYLANLVIWFKNRITLDELGTAPAFVLSSIFANRLLISVRENHYKETVDIDTNGPSIRFIRRGSAFPTVNNSVELDTFNERVGA